MLWKKNNTRNIICSLSSEGHHAWNRTVVVYLIQELLSIRETYQRPLCCGVDDKNQEEEEEEEEEEEDEDINLGQAGVVERWINCQIQQSEANKKTKVNILRISKQNKQQKLKAKQTPSGEP